MRFSLRTKLTAAFLAVTLIFFLMVSLVINVLLEKQFAVYVMDQQEKSNQAIAALLSSRYSQWGSRWDPAGIEAIGMDALEKGLMLRISDPEGKVLWDAMLHNSGMCASIVQSMSQRMLDYNRNFQGGYLEKQYPLVSNGLQTGTVVIGYYGPYFFSDTDIRYLDALNRMLQTAAAATLLLAVLLGLYMARQLSVPIKRVTATARQIAAGDLKARVEERSSTRELIDLTGTINRLASTLEQQEKLRKRLTADVAHELRTPLATLQSHLEAMLDGIWAADPAHLKTCHEEAIRLSRIVSSLEELTRYDAEAMQLDVKAFDVFALVREIADGFDNQFRRQNIALSVQGEPQFLEGDAEKIRQVVVNILANALKFTPAAGQVRITLSGDDNQVRLVIKDTGIGIPADDLPHIFQRFFRSDLSRSRGSGGSGIGLAIVQSIVEAHHGRVVAENDPQGGSIFTVVLPRQHA